MKVDKFTEHDLSSAETRETITPYAFKINKALLGLPLASPIRRGLAILCDVALIFIAAKLSAGLMAFVAAVGFYKGTAEQYLPDMQGWLRRLIKLVVTLGLFVTSLVLLSESIDYFNGDETDKGIQVESELTSAQQNQIKQYLHQTADPLCSETCQQEQKRKLITVIPDLAELVNAGHPKVARTALLALSAIEAKSKKEAPAVPDISLQPPQVESPKTQRSYSLIEWVKGILSDLGLGLGWAAIYFTLFPLLWRGQTPGKKLVDIRVVALSGKPLSLWDAFGRYGGYGAGFATGLLGFLQIYWDPNRQAIQDKISATVVIKGSVNQTIDHVDSKAASKE